MNLSPTKLHIPDGFLSLTVSIIFWALTMIIVGVAVKRNQETLKQKQIPLMGIMAAFIFAAQMINFPVLGGTSGHLLGGTLSAIILGPWAGMLVMTSVVGLQALLFQDGGLVVMGANIFNMALITSLIGYGLYAMVSNQKQSIKISVIGVAAWLSVIASALLASIQIWLSGSSPARVVFPAMISVHTLIGIGEALITIAAFSFIKNVRPDLIDPHKTSQSSNLGWVIAGMAISLIVVLFSPFASTNPDGLERVASDLGFLTLAKENPFKLFSDYLIPGIEDSSSSTIFAGIVGILVIGTITYLVAAALKKHSSESQSP